MSRSHSRAASPVTSQTAGTDTDADVDEDHTSDEEDEDTSDEEEGDINDEEQAEEQGDEGEDPSEVQDVDNDGDAEDDDDENKGKHNVVESDVEMRLLSPSRELQGSSRTEGGLFRGQAAGIAPNIADMEMDDATGDADEDLASLMGRVHLFTTRDPTAKPYLTMKHRVTPNLEPILTQLGINYSPIKSMC